MSPHTLRSLPSRRRNTALLLFASGVLAASLPAHAQWTQSWGDDFNGPANTTYDHSKWNNEVKQNTGNVWGDGTIQSTSDAIQNAYLDGNGNLVIAMTYDAGTGQYTSARLRTVGREDLGPYGLLEARIQPPAAVGTGAAFWSIGADNANSGVPWPWCGELDIMELQSKNPGHNGSTLHGGQTEDPAYTFYEYGGASETVDLPAGQSFFNSFHTFSVEWAPYHVRYLLDGQPYGDLRLSDLGFNDEWPLEQPFDLILSSGAGANGGTPNGQGFPSNMTVDYVHYSKWSDGAPKPVTGLTASGNSSNSVQLSWGASATSDVTYDIYASTTPNGKLDISTLVAQNVTGTTYTHTGLQPGTTYYYTVKAANFGGESSAATATAQTQAPGNSTGILLSAGGYAAGSYMASKFVIGGVTNFHLNDQIDTSLVPNPAPQEVYRAERFGSAAWTITGLTPGAVYKVRMHFVETAHNGAGQRLFNVTLNSAPVLQNFDIYAAANGINKAVAESFDTKANEYGIIELQTLYGPPSAPDANPTIQAIDVLPNPGATDLVGAAPGKTTDLAINAGGSAAGSFVADEDFNAGYAPGPSTASIDTSGVKDPAPQAVYQTQRATPSTYVVTGLQAGATYDVRMQFAETYTAITGAGQRIFNVNINNQPALVNYDIYAKAGGVNKAVEENYTTKADMYGQIIVQFLYGGVQQPQINGLEVVQTAAATTPSAPTAPTLSLVQQSSSFYLQWNTQAGVTYSVQRQAGTGAKTTLATGLTGNSYTDSSNLVSGTSYTYTVTATNSAGQTAVSNAATQTYSGPAVATTVQINAGGGAAGTYSADKDFSGGGTNSTGNAIAVPSGDTTPMSVYQSERAGTFTYTVPGFTAGSQHVVNLHFAEYYFQKTGQRIFNVLINGQSVLPNFDIIVAAGGPNKGVVESFTVPANANGQYVIQFTNGSIDQPKLSGLEIK